MADIFDDIAAQAFGAPAGGAISAPAGDIFDQIAAQVVGNSGPAEAPPSFWSSIITGAKKTPGMLVDLVKAVPSGLQNLAELPTESYKMAADVGTLLGNDLFDRQDKPIFGTDYGQLERTARGLGTLGAGAAGAGAGALAGAPLAPVTLGLSVPAGAAIGGAAGLLGFDWLNELTGSDAPTTIEEKVARLGENTGSGLALGAIGKAAEAGLSAASGPATKLAQALDRKSLQTRASDYGKASDIKTIETPEGTAQTYVKKALNELLDEKQLGLSRDPAKLAAIVEEKAAPLRIQINDVIKKFDETSDVPAQPDFSGSLNYLYSGKVPADLVNSYINRLDALDNNIRAQGQGKLSYLQQQKVAFGKSWDPADKVLSGFNRQIYTDLKNSIEKYAPEVKGLNQELSKWQIVEPIIVRALKSQEAKSPLSQLRDIAYTTGGVGLPAAVGTMLAGPVGTAAGAAIGLGTKALASPTGQSVISQMFRQVEPAAGAIEGIFGPGLGAMQGSLEASQPSERAPISNLFTPKKQESNAMGDLKDVKAVEAEIDKDPYYSALYEAESGRNPEAKNPKSTAKGGFQFINSTASALKLKDPFDLADSFRAVKTLTDEHKEKFSDNPQLLYAAHFMGSTLLDKVLRKQNLTPKEKQIVDEFNKSAWPRFEKIYNRIASKTTLV